MVSTTKTLPSFLFYAYIGSICVYGYSLTYGWDYYRNEYATGPSTWHLSHSDCGGQMQSPIIFNHATDVQSHKGKPSFVFTDFDRIQSVQVRNSHYTFHTHFTTETGSAARIKVSILPDEYCLHGLHFHWGKNDFEGSEHAVEITRSPLEAHFVSYKCSLGNVKKAQRAKTKDAFLVLAVLFKVEGGNEHHELQRLLAYFPMLTIPQSVPKLELKMSPRFNLTKLVPDTRGCYHYEGSFTTPPCSEIVQWIVFEKTVPISQMQMNLIRQSAVWTGIEDSTKVAQNFRPPQQIDGRKVTHYR